MVKINANFAQFVIRMGDKKNRTENNFENVTVNFHPPACCFLLIISETTKKSGDEFEKNKSRPWVDSPLCADDFLRKFSLFCRSEVINDFTKFLLSTVWRSLTQAILVSRRTSCLSLDFSLGFCKIRLFSTTPDNSASIYVRVFVRRQWWSSR